MKNATLPIFAATLLTEGDNLFHQVPNLRDVHTILKVLTHMGVKVSKEGNAYRINAKEVLNCEAPMI